MDQINAHLTGGTTKDDGRAGLSSVDGARNKNCTEKQLNQQSEIKKDDVLPPELGAQSPSLGGTQVKTDDSDNDDSGESGDSQRKLAAEVKELRAMNKNQQKMIASLQIQIKHLKDSKGKSEDVSVKDRLKNLKGMILSYQGRAKESRKEEAKKKTAFLRGEIAAPMRKKVSNELVSSMKKQSDRQKFKDKELFDVAKAVNEDPSIVN